MKYVFSAFLLASLVACGSGVDEGPDEEDYSFFAPPKVERLRLADHSKTAVILRWAYASGDNINIYRDGKLVGVARRGATSYVDSGLSEGTLYSYQVAAEKEVFGSRVESDLSDVLVVSTLTSARTVPDAPQNLVVDNRVSSGASSKIKFHWDDASDNEEGFNIYRDGKLVATIKFEENKRSYESAGLSFATSYEFSVTAFNDAGESDPLKAKLITLREPVSPFPPTNVSVLESTANTIKLGFVDNASNEDGYMIFIGDNESPAQICEGVDLSECTIDGLESATEYDLRLGAFVVTEQGRQFTYYIPSSKVKVQAMTN